MNVEQVRQRTLRHAELDPPVLQAIDQGTIAFIAESWGGLLSDHSPLSAILTGAQKLCELVDQNQSVVSKWRERLRADR